MKGRIVDSGFIPDGRATTVVKETKYGTFGHTVLCDEEDNINEWDGYLFAEYQCDLQALRVKNKRMQQRLVGMEQMLALVPQDSDVYKTLHDFKYSVERQLQLDKALYKKMDEGYPEFVENALQARSKFRKARNKE